MIGDLSTLLWVGLPLGFYFPYSFCADLLGMSDFKKQEDLDELCRRLAANDPTLTEV